MSSISITSESRAERVELLSRLLARRVAPEPNNTARIQKAYRLAFGRAPTDAEVQVGLAFLATEPMKEYEERKKNTKDTKEGTDGKDTKKDSTEDDAKNGEPETVADGMMAGVIPGAAKKEDGKKLLPPTAWGRYVKILLSSNEFLFVD